MAAALEKKLKLSRQRLNDLSGRRVLQSPVGYLQDRRMALDYLHRRLCAAGQRGLDRKRQRFVRLTAALDAMSPMKVLSRGYTMAKLESGKLIKSVEDVETGDMLRLLLIDGTVGAQVTNREKQEADNE